MERSKCLISALLCIAVSCKPGSPSQAGGVLFTVHATPSGQIGVVCRELVTSGRRTPGLMILFVGSSARHGFDGRKFWIQGRSINWQVDPGTVVFYDKDKDTLREYDQKWDLRCIDDDAYLHQFLENLLTESKPGDNGCPPRQ